MATLPPQILIPAGSYFPFIQDKKKSVRVDSFYLDQKAVSNREFIEFLKKNPKWTRSKISPIFSDSSYLKHFKGDLELNASALKTELDQPVTSVSWYAAQAYCQSLGKELPTTDQWEFAAEENGQQAETNKAIILEWYSKPALQSSKQKNSDATLLKANSYGIIGLHGLIWEWTQDFNSIMSGSELRSDGTKDDSLFCGSGSLNALDATDYAKFMRYSFRNSLHPEFTIGTLGFRCAKTINPTDQTTGKK